MPPDPLADLVAMLSRDGKPSLAWVIAHAPDGDLRQLWDACEDPGTMRVLAAYRGARLVVWGRGPDHPAGIRLLADAGLCGAHRRSGSRSPSPDVCPLCATAIRRAVPVPPTLAELLAAHIHPAK